MALMYWLGAILFTAVLVYLLVALLRPEKF